uniref:Uncharacterized protein n=1 Tax=Oryza glaberrima TaxID=4538 RepID=A0A679BCB4_ORYGL|nr:hypothetical protein [Oryza glaberrima]
MDRIASLLKNIKGGLLDLQAILASVFVLQWISPWMFWLLRATNGIVVLAILLACLVLVRGIRREKPGMCVQDMLSINVSPVSMSRTGDIGGGLYLTHHI